MAVAAATWDGASIRAGLVVGADLGRSWSEQIPPPFDTVVSGHPLPTAASEDAGRRALALADSVRPRRDAPRPGFGRRVGVARRARGRRDARRQATDDESAAAGWRGHLRAQYRPQAPVGDQRWMAGCPDQRMVPHAGHLRRGRRRLERDRIRADGCGRQHVRRRARRLEPVRRARRPFRRPSSSGCDAAPPARSTTRRRPAIPGSRERPRPSSDRGATP